MSRIAAIAALALLAAAAALAVVGAVQSFPHGLTVLACLVLGVVEAWFGLLLGQLVLASESPSEQNPDKKRRARTRKKP